MNHEMDANRICKKCYRTKEWVVRNGCPPCDGKPYEPEEIPAEEPKK